MKTLWVSKGKDSEEKKCFDIYQKLCHDMKNVQDMILSPRHKIESQGYAVPKLLQLCLDHCNKMKAKYGKTNFYKENKEDIIDKEKNLAIRLTRQLFISKSHLCYKEFSAKYNKFICFALLKNGEYVLDHQKANDSDKKSYLLELLCLLMKAVSVCKRFSKSARTNSLSKDCENNLRMIIGNLSNYLTNLETYQPQLFWSYITYL